MAAMVKHYGERRRQLNPFEEGSQYEDAFAVGYSGGYSASFLVPIAAEAKAAQAAARLPYMAALLRSVNTMTRSIKGVTVGSAMWTGGRIASRMPDVDWNVGSRVADVQVGSRARHIVGQTADTLRNTPLPAQRRISRLTRNTGDGDVMDWLTRRVESPDSNRYQQGLEYLRRTGADGKQLLSRLSPDARTALLRLQDEAALQRQLTQAWVRGDIDAADIGRATRRYDDLDPEAQAMARASFRRSGPDGLPLLADDVCNSPCESVIRAVYQHTKSSDGLSNDEASDLLDAYDEAGDVSVGPGRNGPGEIQAALDRANDDGVDGVVRAMSDISGTRAGYKGLAGEVDVTDAVHRSDAVDASDVRMSQELTDADGPLTRTEIDVNVEEGSLEVSSALDGTTTTVDSPNIESKNWNPGSWPPDEVAEVRDEFVDLERKLQTQAATTGDDIVVVTTDESLEQWSERWEDLPSNVKAHPSVDQDTTVTITTYDQFGS